MTMFDQSYVNWAFTALGAMGGFILKATWDALVQLRKDMSALQESISTNYVRRDDFKTHAQRVELLLDRIYERLDSKADKP
jgi:hypothetical protein